MTDASKTGSPLGEFLRAHRERITPQQAGLPAGSRRRAKGLRREEVAALCGISPTWLTWIEQGRTESVSAGTLSRLAEALMLTHAEREYLFNLAGLKSPHETPPDRHPQARQALLDAVGHIDTPAYVMDGDWCALAWNRPAQALFLGWLDQDEERPCLLNFMFLNPASQTLVEDWPTRARRMVAEFRADVSTRLEESELADKVDKLRSGSAEFDSLWRQHDVQGREGGERAFHHPEQGRLVYRQITLNLAVSADLKLVMLL
ncbi:helix-turn-helix transcriptional regulator [uncultured Aquitalea sp.]|uniref:helix-turn-helix transcriptional regulator n=1 Tax=uncultured Aquitalea sp. TaxID=540272 RepID=UPI002600E21C|nr:helix-turn-helix transcriptional regulator [uncultured Aquitalea sp.]